MHDATSAPIRIAQQQPAAGGGPAANTTDRSGVVINVAPGSAEPKAAHPELKDIAGIAQILVWPLILLVVAIVFRRAIATFFSGAASRIKSFSVAGVSVELAAQPAQSLFVKDAAVDAGTDNDVNDSTLRSFYEQIEVKTPLEFAVVDLGEGREWLTSRLYILSVILKRMRNMQAVVFVDTAKDVQGRFVGVCASDVIRWRLARTYPKLEVALANGEARAWDKLGQTPPPIDDDHGRFTNPGPAADLLRGFLGAIQAPGIAPNEPSLWQQLSPGLFEYAHWLDKPLVEKLFAGALDVGAMSFDAFRLADRSTRARLVVEHPGSWLPLMRADGRFQGLVNRARVVQALAAGSVASA